MSLATQARRSPFGHALRHWRQVRGKSQLALALDAEVSARHVSFIETGRAHPSRAMIHTLATALNVPLRERNTLFVAAGYAPAYRESDLDAPELQPARRALDLMLARHEPFPAVVMNRCWDVLLRNRGAELFFSRLAPASVGRPPRPPNVLRQMLDPDGLRPAVENWEEVAGALIQRVHREALGGTPGSELQELLEEVLAFPGVPAAWREPDLSAPLAPLVPVGFRHAGRVFRFFSAVTTLGTAQDVTLQELRVESFFPADGETEAHFTGTFD
ncbi:MAG: helix-turn-helix transcriptional regulator [Acidobacteria bacterium]|nr:helix-turn-helix transcriptional regulator [Acidobacteriota bacterium]